MADLTELTAAQTVVIAGTNNSIVKASTAGIETVNRLGGQTRFGVTRNATNAATSPVTIGNISFDWMLDKTGFFTPSSVYIKGTVDDTSAGTGIKTIRITYLDHNFAGPYTEDVTMNGTTLVQTASTDVGFIDYVQVLTGTILASSEVHIYRLSNGTFSEYDINGGIQFDRGIAQHWIPAGKTCYITDWAGGYEHGTLVTSGNSIFTMWKKTSDSYYGSAATEGEYMTRMHLVPNGIPPNLNFKTGIPVVGPAKIMFTFSTTNLTAILYDMQFSFIDE